ncbi:MAG: type II CRISPR RNA-guided endonuclease Cas9, partial [Cytophagales bacterium]
MQKEGNKEVIPNAERRKKRGGRRRYNRIEQRKSNLLKCLVEYGMIPAWVKETTKGKANWLNQKDPHELRAKALHSAISLDELGKILYHMATRRGFKSNRKDKNKGDQSKINRGVQGKESKKSEDINPLTEITGAFETKYQLKNEATPTLGSYLYQILPKHKQAYKDGLPRVRARYTNREMYIAEFDAIWDKQATYHELLKDKDLREKIGGRKEESMRNGKRPKRRGILFDQRPLQSQKHLVGKCTLEPSKTRCPISHPLFETFRAYKFANTIKCDGQFLSQESRKKIAHELLSSKGEGAFSRLKKRVPEKGRFNYDTELHDNKIKGSPTTAALRTIFKGWDGLPDDKPEYDKKLDTTVRQQLNKNTIWHVLYTYDDADCLKERAQKDFGLTEKEASDFSNISLPQGYAKFSRKALRRIVPHLKAGHLEHEAILLAGVENAFQHHQKANSATQKISLTAVIDSIKNLVEIHKTTQKPSQNHFVRDDDRLYKEVENELKKQGFNKKSIEKCYQHTASIEVKYQDGLLPTKKKDNKEDNYKDPNQQIQNLRNPNVIKSLFMLRKVYNALVKQYGKPDVIRIELARDLKRSKKEREATEKQQRINEKINKKAKEELEKLGKESTPYNVLKYKLWEECNRICPYTLDNIPLEDGPGALLTNQWEIEHIVPRSVLLNDSFSNLTLCRADINQLKNNQTPYEFFQNNPHKIPEGYDWKGYVKHLREIVFKIPQKKRPKGSPKVAKFNRFTMEKKAGELNEMSSRYLNDTRYISREATKYLKQVCGKVWTSTGEVTSILRSQWKLNDLLQLDGQDKKNRDDHRHHAIDALVIASTTPSYVKTISDWRKKNDYMKQWKAWKENKGHKPQCPWLDKPWDNIKEALDEKLQDTLVGYHSPNRVITYASRMVKKNVAPVNASKKKYEKIRHGGLAARGKLHEETYYGKRLEPGKDKNDDSNYRYHVRKRITDIKTRKDVEHIADLAIRKLIHNRIVGMGGYEGGGNKIPKNAFYEKKYHVLKTAETPLTEDDTIELRDDSKHKKAPLEQGSLFGNSLSPTKEIKVKDLKNKQNVELIVDEDLKERIKTRIRALGGYVKDENVGDEKKQTAKELIPLKTFYSYLPTLFLKNERGDDVPIRKVRMAVRSTNMQPLKSSHNVHVEPGNNFCCLIYKNADGKQQGKVVSFM